MPFLDSPMLFVASSRHDEARRFYADVLGFTFVADEPFAVVFDAHGVQLRIQKMENHQPVPYTVLGWAVEDVAAAVDELVQRGATFERFEGMPQDERGIWSAAPGVSVAWFKDPDGNLLSFTGP
jgi:catechol 2,3-dioxygenase-like lactoylglutathione lyase family enzyme